MRHRLLFSATALAAAIAAPQLAHAFSPTLSPDEVKQAVEQGKQMASDHSHGYQVKDWVLFDVKDPLRITPDEGQVEAVVVRTPFEFVRYRSYLNNWTGRGYTDQQAKELAAKSDDQLRLLVYGHSAESGPEGKDFLQKFTGAQLKLSDGTVIKPTGSDVFGPAQDFYNVEGQESAIRWLGYRAFVFDFGKLDFSPDRVASLKGTFSFTDPQGKDYSLDLDLAKYH